MGDSCGKRTEFLPTLKRKTNAVRLIYIEFEDSVCRRPYNNILILLLMFCVPVLAPCLEGTFVALEYSFDDT